MSWFVGTPEGFAFIVVALTLFCDSFDKKTGLIPKFLKRHSNVKPILLFSALAFNALSGYYNHLESENQKAVEAKYRQDFQDKLTKRETDFRKQNDSILKKQGELEKTYSKILEDSAKRNADAGLLNALAVAEEQRKVLDTETLDLKVWLADVENEREKQRLKLYVNNLHSLDTQREEIKLCLPIWSFTIDRFISLFAEVARQHGQTLTTDYKELPTMDKMIPPLTDKPYLLCSSPILVGTVRIESNALWRCEISIPIRIVDRDGLIFFPDITPSLELSCYGKEGKKMCSVRVSKMGSRLTIPDERQPFFEALGGDYKKVVNKCLMRFIAVEAKFLWGD